MKHGWCSVLLYQYVSHFYNCGWIRVMEAWSRGNGSWCLPTLLEKWECLCLFFFQLHFSKCTVLKIRQEGADDALVLEFQPTQSWFTSVVSHFISFPRYLSQQYNLTVPCTYKRPHRHKLRSWACNVFEKSPKTGAVWGICCTNAELEEC